MTAAVLREVLEATGYLENGQPAPGVRLDRDAQLSRRGRQFAPDALWRSPSSLTVHFKHVDDLPPVEQVAMWRREIWNEGFAPLLWVVSPKHIDLYNGFGRPLVTGDAELHRLRTFEAIDRDLKELDALAGRLAMETGQFWQQSKAIDRRTSVDQQLLSDLAALERDLVKMRLDRLIAQGLIGRSIFTQYLIDRKILDENRLLRYSGERALPAVLRNPAAAATLFGWLGEVFNGDMFPASASANDIGQRHLSRIADFLEACDPASGQTSLFPYRFDIIPVELISSIYEQFVHSKMGDDPAEPNSGLSSAVEAKRHGVHYTRLPVVSLILDEVMDGLVGGETVLDLTCGSGVFLVEALRRLVALKAGNAPTREMIRSTLYHQIYGVDVSEAAIRVAAFSLYLAALELDPDPQPPELLKFKPLIGHTLIAGDARNIENTPAGAALRSVNGDRRRFDVIVGNPPWTFRGKAGTEERRKRKTLGAPMQPRGESLDFVLRAMDFGHERTRYGVVLSAMPFFARSQTGIAAAHHLIRQLSPVIIVNLAALRSWLFPSAKMPAVVLLARCRPQCADRLTIVNVPWSPSGERSHTFGISPSAIVTLSLRSWEMAPERLKAAAMGRGRDRFLLEELRSRYGDLDSWLALIGSRLRVGSILGHSERGTCDAAHLRNLEVLRARDLKPFRIPDDLDRFHAQRVERSREGEMYRTPLLLVKECPEGGPRPVAAVTDRNLVYTNSCFGAVLGYENRQSGHLIAAILSSALASWFFLMTSSEFGIGKRRLLAADLGSLPIPTPSDAIQLEAGRKLLALEEGFRSQGMSPEDWDRLDQAVFDLYELDDADRIVVSDGLARAGWQWRDGLLESASPADLLGDLKPYARTFMTGIETWLQATGKRRLRAEVYDLSNNAPLRIIRFVIENEPGPSLIDVIRPKSDLAKVLARIGERLGVRLGSSLVGERELRVHGPDEVIVIKPAARRFWMRAAALEDADAVVVESFGGTAT